VRSEVEVEALLAIREPEFLAKRFHDSRRKAYYLMAIHENLARIPKHQLREAGWSKATELVKVARKTGRDSIVQPGCTAAQSQGTTEGGF
jgi:hypothetical protein